MELEETIFNAVKRVGFLCDGFSFSSTLKRSHKELDVLQAFFMKESNGLKISLWPLREAEEFVDKAVKQLENVEKSLTHFDFHGAHFHANAAHGFLSRVAAHMSLSDELEEIENTTLWNGLTYGFGIAFLLYLTVFTSVFVLLFLL